MDDVTENDERQDRTLIEDESPADLCDLLDRLKAAADEGDQTSVGAVLDHIGMRSFAPILLVAGLVMLAPVVGDIPGVPVLMGLIVILTAGQMLLKRDHVWMPQWLLRRSVDHRKVEKTVGWLRRPAGFIDRWSRRRLTWAVHHAGAWVIAVTCILLAAATPAMEFVPFSANVAGVAITAFGVALIAQDGAIALGAMAVCAAGAALMLWQLLG